MQTRSSDKDKDARQASGRRDALRAPYATTERSSNAPAAPALFRTTDIIPSLTASPVQMKALDTALLQFRSAVLGRTDTAITHLPTQPWTFDPVETVQRREDAETLAAASGRDVDVVRSAAARGLEQGGTQLPQPNFFEPSTVEQSLFMDELVLGVGN